jgi:hypothetical protein
VLCLFVTRKTRQRVGSPAHSHKLPCKTGVTRLRTNVGRKGACAEGPGEGGYNKIEGGEGNECCVFLSLKIHETGVTSPAHSHELHPAKQASPAFNEHWEKGHVRAEGGY